ncbi:MAG: helix-turn-helix transcriptional regulator [Burkholderiales bacterium]
MLSAGTLVEREGMKSAKAKRGDSLGVVRRQREMLQAIPRLPLKVTARQLADKLAAKGFEVSKRSVERDLVKLEGGEFGIVRDEGHPHGWSFGRDAPTQLLGLSLNTALTLKLAYGYVRQLVPASLLGELKALVDAADKSLETTRNNRLARWPDKVRVLTSGPARTPPNVAQEVHLAVSEALLKSSQLKISYRSLASGKAAEYTVSPLGMVLKGGVIYVVAWREDKPAPITLSLHRILKAEIEHLAAKAPPGWTSLDAHIDSGQFLFPPGPVEKDCLVTLRFDSVYAQNIREMPLSAGQTIVEDTKRAADGKPLCLVRARVTVSEEFVRWLLQYGDAVEVVKPGSLRERVRALLAKMHSRYKKD